MKLKIEENELLQENPEVKKELIRVIQDYADVFAALKCQIGTTELIQFDI